MSTERASADPAPAVSAGGGAAPPATPACSDRYARLIDAHFAARIDAAGERDMRMHLPGCVPCRDRYTRHLRLARLDPRAIPYIDRMGAGLGFGRRHAPRRLPWKVLGPLAAAAAALLLLLRVPTADPTGGDAPVARGHRLTSQLLAYEIGADGSAKQVGARLTPDSRLAFAYSNAGGRRHLWVFAVDADGRVFWYYPAWTNAHDDPPGIDIADDKQIHELPAAIRQPLAAGPLTVCGIFGDQNLGVRAIESEVAKAHKPSDLGLPNADVSCFSLHVEAGP